MKWLSLVLLSIIVAVAMAGRVVINGACRDCSPPDAETLVVGGQVYKGRPGAGTVIIGSPDGYSNNLPPPRAGGPPPIQIPEGFSGRVPGGTYVHNSDCAGCSISGGDD
ncbi:immune-induced peptide 23 [Scaptodrosophila lebanonensis]|uniref:Immune-induced peptide 23 n=1 Tax=Drosophila lebanonensis TaxID=7225 RepID=A0A6J2TGM8_DROLE|nr:immune-induced peptide 23 [Scaptodrosophila lebanonensis]